MRSPIPSPWDSASTGVLAVLPSPDSWEELLGPVLPVPGGMVLRVLVLLFFLALLVRIAQFRRRLRALYRDETSRSLEEILNRRLARGEISREEYERRKEDLDL